MKEKTIEEYCRLIDKLDKGEGVKPVDIASSLRLSKNTVTLTLQKLSEENFVNVKRYGKVKLLIKGQKISKKMNFKHRVIETFLFKKLKMDKIKIHAEACEMEHAMSDEVVNRLYHFIGKPKQDPHGRKIL